MIASATAHADTLTPDDLAHKNDGGYFTGLPLIAYSVDFGLGLGARVYYYWDGDKKDPRFATTPYLYRIFAQAFASTDGLQFHWIDFDAPNIGNSPYRVRSQLIYMRNTISNYFGIGDASLAPLAFPGSPGTYRSYSDYTADQQRAVDGVAYTRYDQYDLIRPIALGSIERLFLDDKIRVLGGVGISYAKINDYTGKQVSATDATGQSIMATEAPTRLATDCAAGKLVGCGGGRDNFLRLGISYDTRDFEPDPNSGVYLDAALDAGTVALGSQFDYVRGLIAARGYWSPIPETADLVLAGRGTIVAQSSGVPLFSMDTFPFTEDPRTGLGGHRTMRGFRQDRFVGHDMTLLNFEVRYTWGHIEILKQKFAFIVAPFVDIGRPFDSLSELSPRGWRRDYGGAFRVSWNLATIVTVDYGFSDEDTGFYVNFNHMF